MLYGPDTDQAALARMRESLARGRPVREEVLHYAKDGRALWLDLDVVPLGERPGGFSHLIAVLRDVTARKQTEQALIDSERELQMFTRMLQRTAEAAQAITRHQTLRGMLQEVASQARLTIGAGRATISLMAGDDWTEAVTAESVAELPGGRSPPPATVVRPPCVLASVPDNVCTPAPVLVNPPFEMVPEIRA